MVRRWVSSQIYSMHSSERPASLLGFLWEHSNAVSLAAATEPSVEEPLPLRESTASLCTFRTSCVALNIPRPKQGLDENGKQRQKIKNEMTYCKVVTQALGAPGVSSTQKVIFLLWCTNI